MIPARRLFSHLLPPLVMIAGLLPAAFGMACQGGRDASGPNNGGEGTNTPDPATAHGEGREGSGFSDGHVLFGQSAAFTGPAQELGRAMRLGIEAAFHEANQEGGVYGRELQLKALDDGYETYFAVSNTQQLIENEGVFALIGAGGHTHVPRGVTAGPDCRGTLPGSVHGGGVPARPGAGQCAQPPRIVLPGNRGDGVSAHRGSGDHPRCRPLSGRFLRHERAGGHAIGAGAEGDWSR